jgi:hypothetical protein
MTMTAVHASDLGVIADGTADDTRAFNAAIAAACKTSRVLYAPIGTIKTTDDLVVPLGFTGSLSIRCQSSATKFVTTKPGGNGFLFDLGADPSGSFVELWDATFIGAGCAAAVVVKHGEDNTPSQEAHPGSLLSNCRVLGGFAHGFELWNAWHARVNDCYAFGDYYKWQGDPSNPGAGLSGPGSGVALRHRSGVNFKVRDFEAEFFSQAWRCETVDPLNPKRSQDCQGVSVRGLSTIQCQESIHAYGTKGGTLAGLNFSDLMLDSGNLPATDLLAFCLEHATAFDISGGSIWQKPSLSVMEFRGCTAGRARGLTIETPGAVGVGVVDGCSGVMVDAIYSGPSVGVHWDEGSHGNWARSRTGSGAVLPNNDCDGDNESL